MTTKRSNLPPAESSTIASIEHVPRFIPENVYGYLGNEYLITKVTGTSNWAAVMRVPGALFGRKTVWNIQRMITCPDMDSARVELYELIKQARAVELLAGRPCPKPEW